jgi:predicted RNase H-like HicB family nuclease
MMPDFTAIIEETDDGWYIGQLQEMPEVISQGKTIDELQNNMLKAFKLVIESHRERTLQLYEGRKIIKKRLSFA